ncbi:M23 family metallopeptidase, partial [Chitinispirillales bacterium ANBcel5]|uniref:M23 family metallopeptidase n=1 Tax=Cellulosispirillum alkaliphilum TaxID=3039283 RepID=UPI002A56E82F|nr:M23 family metallopeptidase [Chitinispirillales bacterium ANBcel5]
FTDMEVFKKNFVKRVESGGRLKMRVNYAQPANWRPPIDDPMLCLYSQGGHYKPWHGSFGENIRDGVRNHNGVDLLAKPGAKVYACFDSEVNTITTAGSAGKVLVLKIKDTSTFLNIRNQDYKPMYKDKGELIDVSFTFSGSVYLVFMHLSKNDYFKVGDNVGPNDVVGLTGITGVVNGTRNPHLHFEITNAGFIRGLERKCNPCIFFNIKTEQNMTEKDKVHQKQIKDMLWK